MINNVSPLYVKLSQDIHDILIRLVFGYWFYLLLFRLRKIFNFPAGPNNCVFQQSRLDGKNIHNEICTQLNRTEISKCSK